jgi:hypothetical protein
LSESKRTGSRDISDLKARLGLKKGPAAPTTGQTRGNGVVAPPGMNLPPPPGMAQPQAPAQPVIPNAADDPFGAMNAMAAVGTVQRAPEIVIVNDGKPVESVGRRSVGVTVAILALPVLAGLGIGVAIGKIGADASSFNAGLDDAKALLGDKSTPSTVSQLKQTLSQIDTVLDEAQNKNQLRPDANTDKRLTELVAKLEVKSNVVFRAKQNALDAETSTQVTTFYAGIAELKGMLDQHLKVAKADDNVFAKARKAGEDANLKEGPLAGQSRYWVVVQAPSDKEQVEFGAKIVEIGGVFCGVSNTPTATCPEGEQPTAVAYRSDLEKNPIKGDIAQPTQDAVPTKKMVPLLGGNVRDGLIKSADGVASEVYYQRRLRAIADRICKREPGNNKCGGSTLLDLGNRVEAQLETQSKRSSKFSFFL